MSARDITKQDLLQELAHDSPEDVARRHRKTALPSKVLIECFEEQAGPAFLRFAAVYPNTPSMLLQRIQESCTDSAVLQAAGAHHRMPSDPLLALARHEEACIRRAVAANGSAPPQALELLAGDPWWTVRQAVAANSNAPVRILESLLEDVAAVRTAVLARKGLPQRLRDRALKDADPWTAAALADSASGREALLELADSDHHFLQHQLLQRRSLADEVLESLSFSPHADIRLAAIRRRTLAPDEFAGWALSGDEELRLELAGKDGLPASVREVLAHDDATAVRVRVASRADLAPSELTALAADPVVEVRMALAANSATPDEIFELLLISGEARVHKALCRRDNLTPAQLDHLVNKLQDSEIVYHLRVAGYLYRHVSEPMAERLSKHRLPRVREFAAASFGLSRGLQSRLRADPAIGVREVLAANPSVAPSVLNVLCQDRSKRVANLALKTVNSLQAPTEPSESESDPRRIEPILNP